jgi:hypothetical protein
MKKVLVFSFAIILIFGVTSIANAMLWDRGGGLIYDDYLEITWLQDANYYGGTMTWTAALDWADGLSYYDTVRDTTWTDWRLPDAYNQNGSGPGVGHNVTDSEMGHMFYNNLGGTAGSFPGMDFTDGNGNSRSFTNLQTDIYWYRNEYNTTNGWEFYFFNGYQSSWLKTDPDYAWAVRDGDVAAVPIPGAVWLLGSGLIGIVGIRKKFKK